MDCTLLKLHTVLPKYLKDRNLSHSEIWYREVLFRKGQFYHISAPSGSGKTSLAEILYGMNRNFAGTYLIGEEFAKSLNLEVWQQLRQHHFSIVFQTLDLFDELTVLENLAVKNEIGRHLSQEELKRFLDDLKILPLAERKCESLSRGEKQRVAIARALCQNFDWLILDEAFSHLDNDIALKAAQLIESEVKRQGAGIINLQLGDDDYFDYHDKLQL